MTLIIRTTGIEDYLDQGQANIKALILGAPSAGKTRSASFWPKPIFADCEKGRMSIADRSVPYAEIGSTRDMDALLDMLRNECRKPPHERKYQTLVVDTLDAFQRIVIAERLDSEKKEALSGWGDWGYLDGKMTQFVAKLQSLPMNIVCNVHVKTTDREEGDATITQTGVKLKGDFKDQVAAEFDLVGHMGTYWEAGENGEGRVLKRGIQWWPEPTKPILKDRSGQLPRWTPVTFTEDDFGNLFASLISHLDNLGESQVVEELQTDPAVTHQPVQPTPGGPVQGAPVIPPTAAKKAAPPAKKAAAPPAKAAEPEPEAKITEVETPAAEAPSTPVPAPAEAVAEPVVEEPPVVQTPTPVAVPAAPKPSVPAAAKPEIPGADAAPQETAPTPAPVAEAIAEEPVAAPEPVAEAPSEEPMSPEAVAEALDATVISEEAPTDPVEQQEAPAVSEGGTDDQGSDGTAAVATCGTPSLPPEELEPGFVPVQGCGKTLDAEPNPDLVEIGALKTRTNLCNACFAAFRASTTK